MSKKVISFNEPEIRFVEQEVVRVQSENNERVLIVCDRQGLQSFKKFIDTFCYFLQADGLVLTDKDEIIISLYVDELQNLLVNLSMDMFNGTVVKGSIPNICYRILTDKRYEYLIQDMQPHISRHAVEKMKDFVDDYGYDVLGKEDLELMNEESILQHMHVTFSIVTDTITAKFLEVYIKEPKTFIHNVFLHQYVIPSEVQHNNEILEMWKNSCIEADKLYALSVSKVGINYVSRQILPHCISNQLTINVSLINLMNFFKQVGKIDELAYGQGFKKLIHDMSNLLDDYKHLDALKLSIDKCIQELEDERLPF